jgi:hypothetical protein
LPRLSCELFLSLLGDNQLLDLVGGLWQILLGQKLVLLGLGATGDDLLRVGVSDARTRFQISLNPELMLSSSFFAVAAAASAFLPASMLFAASARVVSRVLLAENPNVATDSDSIVASNRVISGLIVTFSRFVIGVENSENFLGTTFISQAG